MQSKPEEKRTATQGLKLVRYHAQLHKKQCFLACAKAHWYIIRYISDNRQQLTAERK